MARSNKHKEKDIDLSTDIAMLNLRKSATMVWKVCVWVNLTRFDLVAFGEWRRKWRIGIIVRVNKIALEIVSV